MKMPTIALMIAVAALSMPFAHAEPDNPSHVTLCDLVSHGMTVGHGTITRTPTLLNGKSCVELRLSMDTKVNLLFFKFDMKMDEVWISDESGLLSYKWDSVENGRRKTIRGELENGSFNFEIVEEGRPTAWTAPCAAFDMASISHPEPALAAGETRTLRVLDPVACTIEERTYRGTGSDTLKVGNREVRCDTVAIEYPGTDIRRWYIADEFGPLILREDSRQDRGTYSRRAVSLD